MAIIQPHLLGDNVFLAAVLLVQYVFRLGYLSGQTPRFLRPVL